jgi:hypothetical protein
LSTKRKFPNDKKNNNNNKIKIKINKPIQSNPKGIICSGVERPIQLGQAILSGPGGSPPGSSGQKTP